MPAVSKAQQKFMGMVHAAQKGDMKNPSPEVSKAASSMSKKSAKDFASTKQKGLPDHVDEDYLNPAQQNVKNAKDAAAYTTTKHDQEADMIPQAEYLVKLKEAIRKIVRERMMEEDINTTSATPGYQTPYAFGKDKGENSKGEKAKGAKQASLTGYSVVKEVKQETTVGLDVKDNPTPIPYKAVRTPKGKDKAKDKEMADVSDMEYVMDTHDGEDTMKTEDKTVAGTGYIDNAPAFPTKNVAAKSPAEDKKKDKELARVSDMEFVADMHENRWLDLKREVSSPQQKIGRGISQINGQLAEMEKFLEWYGKIKNESGVTNENFWKRTNNNIYKIKERLIRLEQKIRKIGE
jgi:hypothetical protein